MLVSGNKLALHFGCARQHIDQLLQQGVIERRSGRAVRSGREPPEVPDASALEHKRSPRTEADAAHAKAKTELLQIRIMEKQRQLVPLHSDYDSLEVSG